MGIWLALVWIDEVSSIVDKRVAFLHAFIQISFRFDRRGVLLLVNELGRLRKPDRLLLRYLSFVISIAILLLNCNRILTYRSCHLFIVKWHRFLFDDSDVMLRVLE